MTNLVGEFNKTRPSRLLVWLRGSNAGKCVGVVPSKEKTTHNCDVGHDLKSHQLDTCFFRCQAIGWHRRQLLTMDHIANDSASEAVSSVGSVVALTSATTNPPMKNMTGAPTIVPNLCALSACLSCIGTSLHTSIDTLT